MPYKLRQIELDDKMCQQVSLDVFEPIYPRSVICEQLSQHQAWEERERCLNMLLMIYVLLAAALWTRLSFSPRAKGRAMVSGREVSNLSLNLFKPRLAPALRAAFGSQAEYHLVLAPPGNIRFASLVVDRRLLAALLASGITEQDEEVDRRLTQFNHALAQHAQMISHVRTIELLDLDTELKVRVRVDLGHRRYDSAQ